MTAKTNREQREQELLKEAQRLQTKINLIVAPFSDYKHPAYRVIQDYLLKKAEQGDFTLIEDVNRQVTDLTQQRSKVMQELNKLRRAQ